MTSPSSGSSPYNSSCSDSESPGDDPAKEVRFWRRYNRIAFIITTICWIAIIVMLTTGCRKPWPWEKPPTYGCRVYVPSAQSSSSYSTIFRAFKKWNGGVLELRYFDPPWYAWWGDPYNTTNIVGVQTGYARGEQDTIWNRPNCP